jgi:TetR/AcrR family transcriptional regulator
MSTDKRPRRTPSDADRRRDPERTREQILRAAVEEFGAHGYAGARVGRIASVAGVNAQLISYHFDGKAGLYQAVLARWREITEVVPRADEGIDETVAGFVRSTGGNRSFARLLAWEALGDAPAPGEHPDVVRQEDQRTAFLRENVANLRRRQETGELPADVDPGHLLLALFAMASAPTVLPQIVRRILGADPDSPEFQAEYAQQVARLTRHLATPTSTQAADH